jgi:hypothetical protein
MPDIKRFLVAGGVVVMLLLLFWRAAGSVSHSGPTPRTVAPPVTRQTPLSIDPSPSLSPAESSSKDPADGPAMRIYAVSLPELTGLPEDAKAGTPLELWVAWEPPVTKHPRIQRLATGITLDRIVLPVVPEGSPAALLRIPRHEIPSVLYGDRYGALSAVITGG